VQVDAQVEPSPHPRCGSANATASVVEAGGPVAGEAVDVGGCAVTAGSKAPKVDGVFAVGFVAADEQPARTDTMATAATPNVHRMFAQRT
jgi:hypothetical protein